MTIMIGGEIYALFGIKQAELKIYSVTIIVLRTLRKNNFGKILIPLILMVQIFL